MQLEAEGRTPRLFLHSCCAPCSSYVLEYLSRYFEVTVFFYNPNISPAEEYEACGGGCSTIGEMKFVHPVAIEGEYSIRRCFSAWQRVWRIFRKEEKVLRDVRLRMEEAARLAKEGNYDYFTTTLSISPLKNAQKINEIGEELSKIYKVPHLPSDFKKKREDKCSIEPSGKYGL